MTDPTEGWFDADANLFVAGKDIYVFHGQLEDGTYAAGRVSADSYDEAVNLIWSEYMKTTPIANLTVTAASEHELADPEKIKKQDEANRAAVKERQNRRG